MNVFTCYSNSPTTTMNVIASSEMMQFFLMVIDCYDTHLELISTTDSIHT